MTWIVGGNTSNLQAWGRPQEILTSQLLVPQHLVQQSVKTTLCQLMLIQHQYPQLKLQQQPLKVRVVRKTSFK
jgi:hypothetical protein